MLIEISKLEVKYGSKKVLQNINLSLNASEIVTIVGPNGSGKTTLFKAIIGSVPFSKGKISIKPNLRIGYVPQQLKVDQTLPITVERFLKLATRNNNDIEKMIAFFGSENIFRELEFSPDLKSKINEIFVPFEKIVVIKNDKN